MKKTEYMLDNFQNRYESFYPDFGFSPVLASRIFINDLLVIPAKDIDYYVKEFFARIADWYNVYNDYMSIEDSIRIFFRTASDNRPDIELGYPVKAIVYIVYISDEKIQEIINYVNQNKHQEKFLSFAEIHKNPKIDITQNTLKKYVDLLKIQVKNIGNENAKGKFISENDLKKILEAKNG